jgi:hypothetical protein
MLRVRLVKALRHEVDWCPEPFCERPLLTCDGDHSPWFDGDYAPCRADGCDETGRVRSMCDKHYQRWRRTGNPNGAGRDWAEPYPEAAVCNWDSGASDCGRTPVARGKCLMHYKRVRRAENRAAITA